jgi:hypothetical protein
MKQYRINAENYIPDSDCVLSPEDPLHDMIAAQYMDGLNAATRINERKAQAKTEADAAREPLLQYAREYGIRPGTPAWHALHGTTSSRKR